MEVEEKAQYTNNDKKMMNDLIVKIIGGTNKEEVFSVFDLTLF